MNHVQHAVFEQLGGSPSALGWKLWNRDDSRVVYRLGIAGDFLPASGLLPPEGCTWSHMASAMDPCFQDLNIAFANLECPVDVHGSRPRIKWGMGDSFSAPEEALEFLVSLNCKAVGLANNHIYDYGSTGVECTKRAIRARGIHCFGSGSTLAEAPEVLVLATGGVRIGFWAAARGLAESAREDVAGVEPATPKRARQALAELQKQGAVVKIALLHTGLEHTNRPDPDDVSLIDFLAGLGFDVVAACHSHRISGYKSVSREGSHPAFCFYGLGSLSSGVVYTPLEREGLLVVAGLDEGGEVVQVEVRPLCLTEKGWASVPHSEGRKAILDRFGRLSYEIQDGSYRRRFYKDIRAGLLTRQIRDMRVAVGQGGLRGLIGKLSRVRMRHVRRLAHQCWLGS